MRRFEQVHIWRTNEDEYIHTWTERFHKDKEFAFGKGRRVCDWKAFKGK